MAKTITEIAVKVLKELGRLPDGQVAPASQLKEVKDYYNSLYDDLFNRALVTWGSTDSVPEFAVYPIVQLVSGRVGGQFGVDVAKYLVLVDSMENKLAQQIANTSEDDTTPGVYF